ncbi:MAG: hypothetical protein LLG05_14655 [Porphyromonadaceae bacterium]|nr:hypothetical protein [Porphyromonadaceae bacterium]
MLTRQDIRAHYKNPAVMNTIMRISSDEGSYRAGNWDFSNWYKYVNGKSLKLRLSNRVDFSNMILKGRTLYWTLNLFNPDIFQIDYNEVKDGESSKISRKYTTAYTFGIDIDKEHGKDIHDPFVKQSVEALAQYFTDKLREYAPNSVYVLYSGGGIYIMVHHKVFSKYYSKYLENSDPEHTWDEMFAVLGDAFDLLIGEFRDEFFKLHPEYKGYVKPDQLNNSQRVFKTIFSVHKSLDYAVVPLDPESIKIEFERATLPLKPEVLAEGEKWYTQYDDGEQFLNVLLKPFIEKALSRRSKAGKFSHVYTRSSEPLEDISKWPPCMRNIYQLPKCGEGATRALANFASFLGQVGIEEEKAHSMFIELVDRWGARASNLFESYYRIMQVPTCENLNSNPNIGFPKGVSIKNLGVCKPDAKCVCVPSPRYYVDNKAYLSSLYSPGKTQHKTKTSNLEKNAVTEEKCELKTTTIHTEKIENSFVVTPAEMAAFLLETDIENEEAPIAIKKAAAEQTALERDFEKAFCE